eukprot:489512_1
MAQIRVRQNRQQLAQAKIDLNELKIKENEAAIDRLPTIVPMRWSLDERVKLLDANLVLRQHNLRLRGGKTIADPTNGLAEVNRPAPRRAAVDGPQAPEKNLNPLGSKTLKVYYGFKDRLRAAVKAKPGQQKPQGRGPHFQQYHQQPQGRGPHYQQYHQQP